MIMGHHQKIKKLKLNNISVNPTPKLSILILTIQWLSQILSGHYTQAHECKILNIYVSVIIV